MSPTPGMAPIMTPSIECRMMSGVLLSAKPAPANTSRTFKAALDDASALLVIVRSIISGRANSPTVIAMRGNPESS